MNEIPNTGNTSLSDMMQNLLSNPEMMQKISGMIAAMAASSPSTETKTDPEPAKPEETPAASAQASIPTGNPGTDGIAALLSDPALMQQLPQILSVLKPMMGSLQPPKDKPLSKNASPLECRDNLLLALKPFLSSERRDAVDSIIRISHLGSVFQQFK